MPLSLLHLGAVLEGRRPWRILDGNVGPIVDAALATSPRGRTPSSA
jgi:hypothetical protein